MSKKVRKLKKERSNKMDTLLKAIEMEETPKKVMEGYITNFHKIVNTILYDILINTYAFLQLNPYLHGWRKHDKHFIIRVIDHESRQLLEKRDHRAIK